MVLDPPVLMSGLSPPGVVDTTLLSMFTVPGGVALRFARVLRYREDKTAAEADTIDTVRAIHAGTRLPT